MHSSPSRRPVLFAMVDLPTFPPFGFSVWYDRHHGRGWCWRERRPDGSEEDITSADEFASRAAAIADIRAELARRKARREVSQD